MVDEASFYGHATQRQAHQQEQQGLSHSSPPSPLTQPGRHRRPVGKAVHHIHRGISTLGHSYSVHSATEEGFSVEIPSSSCWKVLSVNKAGDKQALESQRRVEEVEKWVGLLVVSSSGEGSRVVRWRTETDTRILRCITKASLESVRDARLDSETTSIKMIL